jgi:hypothetical protein
MVHNLNFYLTPNFPLKRKQYPSFSNIAENIFEERLGIKIATLAFQMMVVAATLFAPSLAYLDFFFRRTNRAMPCEALSFRSWEGFCS